MFYSPTVHGLAVHGSQNTSGKCFQYIFKRKTIVFDMVEEVCSKLIPHCRHYLLRRPMIGKTRLTLNFAVIYWGYQIYTFRLHVVQTLGIL
jgi:hypothetical protein